MRRFLFKGNEEIKQKVIETGVRRLSTSSERGCSAGNDSAILMSGSGSRRYATLPSFPSTSGTNRDSGISGSLDCKDPRSLHSSSSYKGGYMNLPPTEASKRRMSNETASPRSHDSQMPSDPVHDRSYSPEDCQFTFEPPSLLDDSMSPHQTKERIQYVEMKRLPSVDVKEDTVSYEQVRRGVQRGATQWFRAPPCPQTQEQLLKERRELDSYDDCIPRPCATNRQSYENVIRHS